MCNVLGVKERGYYQWQSQQENRRLKRKREAHLVGEIHYAFIENKKVFGSRRIKRYLEEVKGIFVSEWKVRRIMRENGLYSCIQKKYKPSKGKKNKNSRYADNLVNQEFTTENENEVWVSDITYIKTKLGWVYLAVVMDLYNREIIGYSVSKRIDTELVLRAVSNALGKNPAATVGTIFHSDRGSQYNSKGLKNLLKFEEMIPSMSKPGCPYDNSCVESFFATLKKECIYRKEYMHINEVEKDLFEYIELFYNRKRLHSFLGYKSPVNYKLLQKRTDLSLILA
jgi:transposase InsO family protein